MRETKAIISKASRLNIPKLCRGNVPTSEEVRYANTVLRGNGRTRRDSDIFFIDHSASNSALSQRVCALGSVLCPTHVTLVITYLPPDVFDCCGRVCIETDSGYPKDMGVTLFTIVSPGDPLRYNTHQSAPSVSTLVHSRGHEVLEPVTRL